MENGEDEVPEDEEEICYDKNKSFFDNISCEATERAKGLVELVPTSLSRPNTLIFLTIDLQTSQFCG